MASVRYDALSQGRPPAQEVPTSIGVYMFEYDQAIVQALLNDDDEFQYLYNRHDLLKEKVRKADRGVLALNGQTLAEMKKEKLHTKDRMAAKINDYRRDHATA